MKYSIFEKLITGTIIFNGSNQNEKSARSRDKKLDNINQDWWSWMYSSPFKYTLSRLLVPDIAIGMRFEKILDNSKLFSKLLNRIQPNIFHSRNIFQILFWGMAHNFLILALKKSINYSTALVDFWGKKLKIEGKKINNLISTKYNKST